MQFKVSKVFQQVTSAQDVRFLQNFVHDMCTGKTIQQSPLIMQNKRNITQIQLK